MATEFSAALKRRYDAGNLIVAQPDSEAEDNNKVPL